MGIFRGLGGVSPYEQFLQISICGKIIPFIEGKLFLKVNRKKTGVAHIGKVKYLGYAFYRYKGKCRFRVHPKSVAKMKDKTRELTKRNNGWGNEYRATMEES